MTARKKVDRKEVEERYDCQNAAEMKKMKEDRGEKNCVPNPGGCAVYHTNL